MSGLSLRGPRSKGRQQPSGKDKKEIQKMETPATGGERQTQHTKVEGGTGTMVPRQAQQAGTPTSASGSLQHHVESLDVESQVSGTGQLPTMRGREGQD